MSEQVIRHRGGGRDENNDPLPWVDESLSARAVAPGASAEFVARGRDGSKVAYTVYFVPAVDLTGDDELTVRGVRCQVEVDEWRSPYSSRSGLVANCSRGKG